MVVEGTWKKQLVINITLSVAVLAREVASSRPR